MAKHTPVGYVPTAGSLRLDGLKEEVDMQALFSLPKDFWLQEVGIWLLFQIRVDDIELNILKVWLINFGHSVFCLG